MHAFRPWSINDVESQARELVGDHIAVPCTSAHIEDALGGRVQMKAVSARANKPGRNLVGMIALNSGVVEGERSNGLAGLIHAIELFPEPIKMFFAIRWRCYRGSNWIRRAPIHNLVTQDPVMNERQSSSDLS